MWIGKPSQVVVKKEEDTTIVVMLRQGEAERLRVILNSDKRHIDPEMPLEFVPFRNKLDQGLELLGVRLKQ